MARKLIYPAIDVRGGQVVRLLQGDYNQQIDYADSPTDVAKRFRDQGAEWIHIVDLDGAKEGESRNFDAISKVLELDGVNFQIGGGIRSVEAIERWLNAGASRVIIGTRAVEDWDWFKGVVFDKRFEGKIVLGLDAREGRIATSGWTEQTDVLAREIAERVSAWPIAAIVYTDIARDGMMKGPNYHQLEMMAEATSIPIIASGGISSIDDVRRLLKLSIDGMIIGRAIYEGRIDLKEALEISKRDNG